MDDRILISENLKMLIKTSGKSQVEIAKALGVTEALISSYIAGRAIPSTLLIKQLCKILNCDYSDIFGQI